MRAELSIHPFIHLPIWHLPAYMSILTSNALALLLSRAPNYCKRPRNTCNEARATGSLARAAAVVQQWQCTLWRFSWRLNRGQCAVAPRQLATTLLPTGETGGSELLEVRERDRAPHALTHARSHVRTRSSAEGLVHVTRSLASMCVCLRLPTPRRSRVPTALCVCRAWDRYCLLLLVLLSPGHGRSRRLGLANRNRATNSNSIILNKHIPSNVSQTCHRHLDRQSRNKEN